MDLVAQRDQLMRWGEQQQAKNGEIWKERYVAANNAHSIDGLPGYDPTEELVEDEARAALQQRASAVVSGFPSLPMSYALEMMEGFCAFVSGSDSGSPIAAEAAGSASSTSSMSPYSFASWALM